ncbi:LacI family DNA-binding transcriptional regulator [Muricomes intestini]|jgi:DNA-binding LacI/PurR family transcriptional regulator|nr:hypothetical protein [Lachnospiraceae bacterium]
MGRKMRVTRKDVANRAGVSTATVSYVLNKSKKISDETTSKVMQAIAELDYRPDMIARSMSVEQTMQVGIVLEDITNPFSGGLIRGFEKAANEKNYFVSVCTSFDKLDDYFDNFIARRIDGIFVAALPYKFNVNKLYDLVDRDIKVVVSGNAIADYKKVSSLENDYIDAMEQVMEYLYALGHRNIAYISGLGKNMTYDLRCIGYRQMITKLGLTCGNELLIDGKSPYFTGVEEGYSGAKRLIETGKKFTAVICTNDIMAFGAMKAIRDHGLRIPEDVSVVGFDGIKLGEYYECPLTSMALEQEECGRKAFDLLYNNMTQGTVGYYKNMLHLVERESTGKCRETEKI